MEDNEKRIKYGGDSLHRQNFAPLLSTELTAFAGVPQATTAARADWKRAPKAETSAGVRDPRAQCSQLRRLKAGRPSTCSFSA